MQQMFINADTTSGSGDSPWPWPTKNNPGQYPSSIKSTKKIRASPCRAIGHIYSPAPPPTSCCNTWIGCQGYNVPVLTCWSWSGQSRGQFSLWRLSWTGKAWWDWICWQEGLGHRSARLEGFWRPGTWDSGVNRRLTCDHCSLKKTHFQKRCFVFLFPSETG